MFTIKHATIVILTGLILSSCEAGGDNLEDFRTFSASDVPDTPDFRAPFTVPIVLVEHSMGFSSVDVEAQLGAIGRYVRGGQGEALPVTVRIGLPKDIFGRNPKVHRSLFLNRQYQFSGTLTDSVNQAAALALAKEVLARTYCVGGEITENYTAQIVDTSGPRPVALTVPMIKSSPPGGGYVPEWIVRLRCGLWTMPL